MKEPTAAPIVKWAGGKTRLLPELLKRVPPRFKTYYEPFVGGAALFFRLAPARAVLSDANKDLIQMYETVRENAGLVIDELRRYERTHSKKLYLVVRALWNDQNERWTASERAAAFIYLNKTCFNGLHRVNRKGEFNVPMGRYKRPNICDAFAIARASDALDNATIGCVSYRDAVASAGRGDFCYMDPPYDPITKTSNFTAYTGNGFGRDEQRELAETARELVARGCHVMISNSNTRFIRSLYRGFQIDKVFCARAINSDGGKRGAVTELIITNKPRSKH